MRRTILAAAILLTTASATHADSFTVGASRDASIFENNPDNGSGAGNGLFAGTNGTSSPRRALVAFDLTAIPTGSTVNSVGLTLTLGQVAGSGGGTPGGGVPTATIGLHRILADWGEGETQRRNPPTNGFGMMGQGEPAEEGDVTWNSRFHSETTPMAWANEGGDFAATISSSLAVGTEINVPYQWPSTPGLVADVAAWIASPTSNFGWMLVNADEASATTFRAFFSRDVATAAYFPRLTVQFTPPTTLTADFTGDGAVDGADLLRWQRGLGAMSGAAPSAGDANGDGAVNSIDLTAWRQQFGSPHALAAVPEPAGTIILWCVVVLTPRRARTSRRA